MPDAPTWTPAQSAEVRQLFADLAALPDDAPEREPIRSRLIEMHLPLVRHLARRFTATLSVEDAIQVGSIGLIKAVDGFTPDRGHEFVSYAVPKVVGEIRRHLRDAAWLVRAPRRAQELQGAVTQAREELTQELGRPPTLSEIARRVGVDAHDVVEVLETFRSREAQTIDPAPDRADGQADTLGPALRVEERGYTSVEIRMDLKQAMRSLDEQERDVVRLRFVDGRSQSEIAEVIGVSQMQVSRILRRSVDRMRRRLQD